MSRTRSFITPLACLVFLVVADAAFEGEWPDRSAGQWAVYVGGFVVIWVGLSVAEAAYTKRQRADEAGQPSD